MAGIAYLCLLVASLVTISQLSECLSDDCTDSITTASGTFAPKGKICSGHKIFEDNFDDLDLSKWQHENTLQGGGNWEFQWYTNNRSVSYTENGILHIKPSFTSDEFGESFLSSGTLDLNGGSPYDSCTNAASWGCSRTGTPTNIINPIKSARIRTLNSFAFKYGKVEVRAKIPTGDWLWPAIWLMPKYVQYGGWPASGEIDIMESRGNAELYIPNGQNIGTQMVASTLHFGPRFEYDRYISAHFEKSNADGYNNTFHKYQMEWTDAHIKFFIDDKEIGTVTPNNGGFWEWGHLANTRVENPWKNRGKMAPFDQEFYIIFNLAVGGTNGYFPDEAQNKLGAKPWKNTSPKAYTDFWDNRKTWEPTWKMHSDSSHFEIDYVKVWAI